MVHAARHVLDKRRVVHRSCSSADAVMSPAGSGLGSLEAAESPLAWGPVIPGRLGLCCLP